MSLKNMRLCFRQNKYEIIRRVVYYCIGIAIAVVGKIHDSSFLLIFAGGVFVGTATANFPTGQKMKIREEKIYKVEITE